MLRKLSYFFVAGATAFSMSAFAGGQQYQQQSQSGASQGTTSESASPQSQAGQNPELVKQAQEKLSAAGHEAGPADGKMGPQTQAALKEFQESKGLEASGRLDQETIAALGVSDSGSASSGASSSSGPSSSAERTAEPNPGGAGPAIGEMSSDKSAS